MTFIVLEAWIDFLNGNHISSEIYSWLLWTKKEVVNYFKYNLAENDSFELATWGAVSGWNMLRKTLTRRWPGKTLRMSCSERVSETSKHSRQTPLVARAEEVKDGCVASVKTHPSSFLRLQQHFQSLSVQMTAIKSTGGCLLTICAPNRRHVLFLEHRSDCVHAVSPPALLDLITKAV